MALSNLDKNIIIGDSAAVSHMTSNIMGVYNLIPINMFLIIGNGQGISFAPTKENWMLSVNTRMDLWEEKLGM